MKRQNMIYQGQQTVWKVDIDTRATINRINYSLEQFRLELVIDNQLNLKNILDSIKTIRLKS